MGVRNFWVETAVDGRKNIDASGPKSKDGGVTVKVYGRIRGQSMLVLTLYGSAGPNGQLQLAVIAHDKLGWSALDYDGQLHGVYLSSR